MEVLRGESRRNCFLTSAETERSALTPPPCARAERKITTDYGFADFIAARYRADIFITYPVNSPNNTFRLIYRACSTFNALDIGKRGKGEREGRREGKRERKEREGGGRERERQ